MFCALGFPNGSRRAQGVALRKEYEVRPSEALVRAADVGIARIYSGRERDSLKSLGARTMAPAAWVSRMKVCSSVARGQPVEMRSNLIGHGRKYNRQGTVLSGGDDLAVDLSVRGEGEVQTNVRVQLGV